MSQVIQQKANRISSNLAAAGYKGTQFNPAIIIAIITAIMQLFKDCTLSPAQAKKRATKPGFLDRVAMRRIIKKHSRGDEEAILAALLDEGTVLATADITAMYKEV